MSFLSIRFVSLDLKGILSLSSCFLSFPDDKPIVGGVACLLGPPGALLCGGGRAGGWAEMRVGGGRVKESEDRGLYKHI